MEDGKKIDVGVQSRWVFLPIRQMSQKLLCLLAGLGVCVLKESNFFPSVNI